MTRAVLSLGANLGDARAALATAVRTLDADPLVELRVVSGLWRTAAVGGPAQPDYLNAIVIVDTALEPAELLELAHGLEEAADRRREVRWGPRTLDVDIIDVAAATSDDPELTLPHPRAHERAFVLAPWSEVDPAARLVRPGGMVGVRQLLAAVEGQDIDRVEPEGWWR